MRYTSERGGKSAIFYAPLDPYMHTFSSAPSRLTIYGLHSSLSKWRSTARDTLKVPRASCFDMPEAHSYLCFPHHHTIQRHETLRPCLIVSLRHFNKRSNTSPARETPYQLRKFYCALHHIIEQVGSLERVQKIKPSADDIPRRL
jgi:hypothetical protein